MEYSRKVSLAEGANPAAAASAGDSRIMDFGTVFLVSPSKEGDDATSATSGGQSLGINVAELILSRGFGEIIKHRDFEERSKYYDALLAAEARARHAKKGIHPIIKESDKATDKATEKATEKAEKEPPVMHINDLTTVRNGTPHV